MKLSDRELATVLAALRYYQDGPRNPGLGIIDIATDGGKLHPMNREEIDTLLRAL